MFKDTYKGVPTHIQDCMELYIDKNDHYHSVNHKRRFARTIQLILDQSPYGSLLEIGTSNFLPMCLTVLAPNIKVTVTDFNLTNPEISELEITLGLHTQKFPCYSVDLEKTPLPADDESFDYVVCSEVIEHMEIDPMFMLSEINRVLKPGGVLILSTPNAVSTHSITKMVNGIEPYFYMQYNKNGDYHRHNYEYSIHTLSRVLKSAGFNGTIWTEDTFEDPVPAVVERLNSAGFNIKNVGDNIFTIAKKEGPIVDRYPKEIYV